MVFIFLSLCLVSVDKAESTLKSVFLLQRHGDRYGRLNITGFPAPSDVILGQITNDGQKRLRATAASLKAQYPDIIGKPKYIYGQHTFYSTYVERTKQSTLSFADGLFKGTGPEFLNKVQPIALESVLSDKEFFAKSYSKCPKATLLSERTLKRGEFQSIKKKNKDLLALIKKETKESMKDEDIPELLDSIVVYKETNFTLPQAILDKMDDIRQLYHDLSIAYTPKNNLEYSRSANGYLIRTIARQMLNDSKQADTRFHYYGIHGTTLQILLIGLGYDLKQHPNYAAPIIFELWQDGETLTIKSKLDLNPKVDGTVELVDWTPNTCPSTGNCTYTEFIKDYADIVTSNNTNTFFLTDCGFETTINNIPILIVDIVLAVLVLIVGAVATISIISLCKQSKKMESV
ncbi:hypothetical protein BLNAU_15998 [Blattamonas nauphoetae]|uniref:Acid phosphatase n=1 Tax=Blattamonas nauphoetae TaxID=2049346 RepID=A0ABQ9X9D3_9EUKA|nr:hypothetical protein BLNAU_15998 [Blattamonas nauphoetae]